MKLFETNFVPPSARFIGRNTEASNTAEAATNKTEQSTDVADAKVDSAMRMVEADNMPEVADKENGAASTVLDGIENDDETDSVKPQFKAFENIANMSDNAPFHKGIASTFQNALGLKPGDTKQIPIDGMNLTVSISENGTVFSVNRNTVDWSDPKNIKVLDKSYQIPSEKQALSAALVEFVNNNF